MKQKRNFAPMLLLLCMSVVLLGASGDEGQQGLGSQGVQQLIKGNERFVSNVLERKDYAGERKERSKGQKPYAIVLTCSDSRVAPEILFDKSHPGFGFSLQVS